MKTIILLAALWTLPAFLANAKTEVEEKNLNTLNVAVSSFCLDATEVVSNAAQAADICYEQANQLHAQLVAQIKLYKEKGEVNAPLKEAQIHGEVQAIFNTEMLMRQSVHRLRMTQIQP